MTVREQLGFAGAVARIMATTLGEKASGRRKVTRLDQVPAGVEELTPSGSPPRCARAIRAVTAPGLQ